MAISQRTVNYVEEVDALMVLLVTILKEVKAGKTVAEIGTELLPQLISVLAGISKLKDELVNKKVLEETIGYRLGDIVSLLTEGV